MSEDQKKKGSFLSTMLEESSAYTSIDLIQSYVEKGLSLQHVPMQPLHDALKSLNPEVATGYLSLLSHEQRVIFQDLDLWSKDNLDTEEFSFWVQTYVLNQDDDLRFEFASGVDFLLYLKGRFNIWTFDVEDPTYPDHDYYFLTDDSLLLFEYDEHFDYVEEVKILIRDLYSRWGVEKAYSYLFKIVSDGALSIMEEEYQLKKGRLADVGFVDYYDALEMNQTYILTEQVDQLIKKKSKTTGTIDTIGKLQALPKSALLPFKDFSKSIDDELLEMADLKRQEYLKFNFMRLVNGSMALDGGQKAGSVAMTRVGSKVKNHVELGFDYCRKKHKLDKVLDFFDFSEIYRIGHSLVQIELKRLKKTLATHNLEQDARFLGACLDDFLDHSFRDVPVFASERFEKPLSIDTLETYLEWCEYNNFVVSFLPYVSSLYQNFEPLVTSGQLNDDYYLNYNVADIDVESVLMSSFAHFRLGLLEESTGPKLGVTLEEFRSFVSSLMVDKSFVTLESLHDDLTQFKKTFGLEQAIGFESYLYKLLKDQIEGYYVSELQDEDFAHVGGPIILSHQ